MKRAVMMAVETAVLGMALLSLSGQRCPAGEESSRTAPPADATRPAPPSDFETELSLQNAEGEVATKFAAGEPIHLAMTVRNRTDAPRSITLTTSQAYDCMVSNAEGREIWKWSRGLMFAQVITELRLAPGETKSYSLAWDQKKDDGTMAPPGRYSAIGLIPGGPPGTRSEPVAFTIDP